MKVSSGVYIHPLFCNLNSQILVKIWEFLIAPGEQSMKSLKFSVTK